MRGLLKALRTLYVQVIIGILLGIAVGALWPETGQALKPLGDGFIRLIKIVIAPVIFCTVMSGIARMRDARSFGRLGGKAILYFEVVSTLALIIGLLVAEIVRPGHGFNIDVTSLDPTVTAKFVEKSQGYTVTDHLMEIIPDTFLSAFTSGNLLQVLLLAILTGFACTRLGPLGSRVSEVAEKAARMFFEIIHIVVRAAPIGAFGAMGFTIGKYGIASLIHLGALIATFYLTSLLFIIVVLGLIARWTGFSIFQFIRYIRAELLIVLGTSSSESVLPLMMERLEKLGAARPVVGLVIPMGYSFNLDGTNIYMTLATLFLAQATNTDLSWLQIATILGVAMITSKGASGVTGAGFITLAATLAVIPDIPIIALGVLVGVDRFMSECRALTNLIGNGVATLAVARWEGQLDRARMKKELAASLP